MTTLREILAVDLASTLDADAPGTVVETVTYTPAGGAAVEADMQFSRQRPVLQNNAGGQVESNQAIAIVMASEIANPEPGDTINFDSENWKIETVKPVSAMAWRMTLIQTQTRERYRFGGRP